MKKITTILGLVLMSSTVFGAEGSVCKMPTTKLEMIQAIASSEALAIQTGPRRDVSAIEVFALSDDGSVGRVNITFSGTNGNSKVVTLKASINCKAGESLELE